MSKIIRVVLVVVILCSYVAPAYAKKVHHRHPRSSLSAKSALLWDITNDKVYFEKNANLQVYPASTTKVMTVLLALERLPLDQYVTVSARSTQVPQTRLNFKAGEQYLVSDLVYACLLKSANDAAGVLAEAVGGSQEEFVAMMNQKAASLGATHTRFANAHGLPSRGPQYTTAKDMALIFKEAMKNPFFVKSIGLRTRVIYSKDGRRHFLKSHNKSLFLNWKQDILGKTGYTIQAQSCFVGFIRKGKNIYIVDVFGCRKRWGDIKWMVERYAKIDL